MQMHRVHLVDGTFELYRAHYSKRPAATAPSGQDVKATVGVLRALLSLFTDPREHATHVAVAFDNPIESFRNELFDGYKTGAGMEPAIAAQMDLVEKACEALGLVVWSMDRYEADDALATAAVRYGQLPSVEQVRVMTPDKDLSQCVRGRGILQVDRIRSREIDEAAVLEQRGVRPVSIPDYLALIGDTADGIPGLPGFGAKSTATLLAEYAHLEHIPLYPQNWSVKVRGAARLAQTLAERRVDAYLYRTLATLALDVPLGHNDVEALRWRGPTQVFSACCDQLGQSRLLAAANAAYDRVNAG